LDVDQQFASGVLSYCLALVLLGHRYLLVELELADEEVGNEVVFDVLLGVAGAEDVGVQH
jgi:hypothetical protein